MLKPVLWAEIREINCWGQDYFNVISAFPEGQMRMITAGGGQFCAPER